MSSSDPTPQSLVLALNLILEPGRVLLLQRRKPPYQGCWSLPGGKVHFGETFPAAAVREGVEETGLMLAFRGLQGFATETIHARDGVPKMHFVMALCWLEPCGGELVHGDEGALQWFETAALPKPGANGFLPTDLDLIRRFHPQSVVDAAVPHYTVHETGAGYTLASITEAPASS